MKVKGSYDYYLILATCLVLFIISSICIYGMFYFKLAQIHEMQPVIKLRYMNRMNTIVAPFIVILILLLGICVPKRILPTAWLNRFAVLLAMGVVVVILGVSIRAGLLSVLAISLLLQVTVLILAVAGSKRLNFEKKGYWLRVGSSLIHLGLILFVFDLFLYQKQTLHLILFWITTGSTVLGMLLCFYSGSISALFSSR